ncbi:MAG TPA: hypothetical protein DER01_20930, partial [Phycisphaerales bacterium]|nr:hypothetical protein [Phycisphaerales bacterium]
MPLHESRQQVDPVLPMVVTPDAIFTWGQVSDLVQAYRSSLNALSKKRVGLPFHADGYGVAVLSALYELECNIFLLPFHSTDDYLQEIAQKFELAAIVKVSVN